MKLVKHSKDPNVVHVDVYRWSGSKRSATYGLLIEKATITEVLKTIETAITKEGAEKEKK